jgi:FkbM family methyltransferase
MQVENIGELIGAQLSARLEHFFINLRRFDKVCLFGAGRVSGELIKILQEKKIKVDFLCDNNSLKWNKQFWGIRCISPQELRQYAGDSTAVILTMLCSWGVYEELQKDFSQIFVYDYFKLDTIPFFQNATDLDVINKNLQSVIDLCADEKSKYIVFEILNNLSKFNYHDISFPKICSPNQYFDREIIALSQEECFVDGGGYTGDSILDFLRETNNKFKKIHSFELLKENYETIHNTLMPVPNHLKDNILVYNLGLYDKEGQIKFEFPSQDFAAVRVSEKAETAYIGQITSLDKILTPSEKVTFIKMDIEGAELNALKGAKEIITTHKPKLAICVYHQITDLWEIPLYIKSLVPEYKIFIRHHTPMSTETVCYAVYK